MTVVDASAILEILLNLPAATAVMRRLHAGRPALAAPHLIDLEVAQVLRKYWRVGDLSEERGRQALHDLEGFQIVRYPHYLLLPRIWKLRNNLSACDAAYVALAELLDAPLLTRDRRLASAAPRGLKVDVV